ncbi:MAG: hypothetical protein GC157_15420 [Frankiales bacterium]|nr:hypothetical protein [Frankiales bacterium]
MRARRSLAAIAAVLCAAVVAGPAYAAGPTAPVAVDDAASAPLAATPEPLVVDVLADDTLDGDAVLALVDAAPPQHGTASVTTVSTDGTTRPALSYLPDTGFTGTDSFRYAVTDSTGLTAQATVTVSVLGPAPVVADDQATTGPGAPVRVAVLDNDSDPASGRLTVTAVTAPGHGTAVIDAGTAVTYTPADGWAGQDTFGYTVTTSSGGTASATVTVTTLDSTPGHTVEFSAPPAVAVLRTVTITGAASPTDAAVPSVTLRVRRTTSSTWITLGHPEVDASGSFTLTWQPSNPAFMVLRADVVWPDGSSATSSARITISRSVDPEVSGALTRADVPWSYRLGCPVGPSSLRRLSVNYYDYRGHIRRGDIILRWDAVPAVQSVFVQAFRARFPFKQIVPTDHFYRNGTVSSTGSDIAAMNAGATSAFNCRKVTGNPKRVSQHSYGNAIDVNTYENPYATGRHVYPAAAAHNYYYFRAHYLHRRGVIRPGSVVARAFAARHWYWGARWSHHDYQHFSSNGG